jgi:hypothetical protein
MIAAERAPAALSDHCRGCASLMERLEPNQIGAFLKRFHHLKGRLRRFRVQNRSAQEARGDLVLGVHEGDERKPMRLKLALEGVEEFRFQRRPGPGLVRLREVRLGAFNGLFFLNLDAYTDEGAPQLIDFRASDAYIAARSVLWEIVPPKS